jgi:hypothetical protein
MLMSTFSPWYLPDGSLVHIYIHAGVDALLIGIPTATIGAVVGARKPKNTLQSSKLHFQGGFGYSDFQAQRYLKETLASSGYEWTAPLWFGRAHWPRGQQVASPYAWGAGVDWRWTPEFQTGVMFASVDKQRIEAANNGPSLYATAWDVAVLFDWVVNPIAPDSRDRFEYATGIGVGYGLKTEGGELGDEEFKDTMGEVSFPLRFTMDWYANSGASVQLKLSTRMHTQPWYDERESDGQVLVSHPVEYSSFDLTIGIRGHLFAQ